MQSIVPDVSLIRANLSVCGLIWAIFGRFWADGQYLGNIWADSVLKYSHKIVSGDRVRVRLRDSRSLTH